MTPKQQAEIARRDLITFIRNHYKKGSKVCFLIQYMAYLGRIINEEKINEKC